MTEIPITANVGSKWRAAPPGAERALELARVLDESALIERAKRDPNAFAVLYRRHYAAIAGYVFRRIGSTHATEDVVSEVFLTAMRSIRRYRYRGVPIRAWFFAIAVNAVSQWAKRQRRRRTFPLADEVDANEEAGSHSHGEAENIRRAMLQLSAKYQAVLSLHYLEGMDLSEIVAVTGWRIGTVKSRLFRARSALRDELMRRRCFRDE